MFWSMSFQLLPGEAIIDSSDEKSGEKSSGIKPSYSVFLTNKRVVFRLDSLRSSMIQSFSYGEILEADTCKRVFINYLRLRTRAKTYFIHIGDPDYWVSRIGELGTSLSAESAADRPGEPEPDGGDSPEKLLSMLSTLEQNGIITRQEYEEKVAVVRERATDG